MALEYDEKGKIFTDVISKDQILCRIFTEENLIQGYVHVRKGDRLSDEINRPVEFLPVTDVEIYNHNGDIQFTCEFIAVNRAHIVWLMPVKEHETKGE